MIEGQYYYSRHGHFWGVWQNHNLASGGRYGDFIQDFSTREEAKDFVYEKNGWKLPSFKD